MSSHRCQFFSKTLVFFSAAALVCVFGAVALGHSAEGFVDLFNGKNFDGWEGNQEFFRVESGAIVAGTLEQPIPRNEFLCTTRDYGDFELRLQAKTVGKGANGGVQIRSRRVPNHNEVRGYQADVGILRGQNIWGALYDEARRRKMLAVGDQEKLAKVFKPDGWNDYVIRCEGKEIQTWINGFQTVDYTEQDPEIEQTGIIGLQVHGGAPSEVWYRNLAIRELR